MAIQTKEDVLDKLMRAPTPVCPHCGKTMNLWEVPPMNFSDGLGWGEPYIFVCFNNECPPFVSGWQEIEENYAHKASTRCFCYPSSGLFEFMPVFSRHGATGQIVDEELLERQQQEQEAIKKGFLTLAGAYADKDHALVLALLMDGTTPARVRLKAADMLADIGTLEELESLVNKTFGNSLVQEAATKAVTAIHERNFTMECPDCAEIIKRRAKVCKHCGKDLT